MNLLSSEQREREGEAPRTGTDLKSVPTGEGATQAPIMEAS